VGFEEVGFVSLLGGIHRHKLACVGVALVVAGGREGGEGRGGEKEGRKRRGGRDVSGSVGGMAAAKVKLLDRQRRGTGVD
jgi:hypothetical protein